MMGLFLPFSRTAHAWEAHADTLRRRLPTSFGALRFDPAELAPLVGLYVMPCGFPGLSAEETEHMLGLGSSQWSGGVFTQTLPDGRRLCMLNPSHSDRRNRMTLMEEICHCHLGHQPTKLIASGDRRIRDFQKAVEAEAYGSGAATLLPWRLLFPLIGEGLSHEELAEAFYVTPELVRYRVKVTGAFVLHRSRMMKRNVAAAPAEAQMSA